MRKTRLTLVLMLVALTLATDQGAEAKRKRKPPIPFSSCDFNADKPGRTYRLTQDLDCSPEAEAVAVLASGVTIDLGGFTMLGSTGVGINGVGATFTVRNGGLVGFTKGVSAQTTVEKVNLSDLLVTNSSQAGIEVANVTSIIIDNVSVIDGSYAGFIINGSVPDVAAIRITDSLASNNTIVGFLLFGKSVNVSGSTATSNGSPGFRAEGFYVESDRARIRSSTANDNFFTGIHVEGDNAVVSDNHAFHNGYGVADGFGTGIFVNGASPKGHNISVDNDDGALDGCNPVTLC